MTFDSIVNTAAPMWISHWRQEQSSRMGFAQYCTPESPERFRNETPTWCDGLEKPFFSSKPVFFLSSLPLYNRPISRLPFLVNLVWVPVFLGTRLQISMCSLTQGPGLLFCTPVPVPLLIALPTFVCKSQTTLSLTSCGVRCSVQVQSSSLRGWSPSKERGR